MRIRRDMSIRAGIVRRDDGSVGFEPARRGPGPRPGGKETAMPRFMVFVPANEESEAGVLPGEEVIDAMTAYNEELAKAGVLLDLNALQPTWKGASAEFSDGQATAVDGSVTEAME